MATFILEDLETINVEKTMKEILDHSITTLANNAKSMGYKPEYIFGIIQSQLLDMPIPIHIHQLNENTIPALWNEFRDVNQSNEDKGRPFFNNGAFYHRYYGTLTNSTSEGSRNI